MSTLVLRLTGALQSWGTSSLMKARDTGPAPSFSGVLGLIANATGLDRGTPLGHDGVTMGVRIDNPGTRMEDFVTVGVSTGIAQADGKTSAHGLTGTKAYLAFASFLVGLTGPEETLSAWRDALAAPARPVHLGRRCCPPSRPVLDGLVDVPLDEVLACWPVDGPGVPVRIVPADWGDPAARIVHDVPLPGRGFAPRAVRWE